MSYSQLESDIVHAAYLHGRGYCTLSLLEKILGCSATLIQNKLKNLKEEGLLKVSKIDKCFIYSLNKISLNMMAEMEPTKGPYLERMKSRNENISVVLDKLRMMNFMAEHPLKEAKYIHPIDKVSFFRDLMGASEKALSFFKVKFGENLYFNDVQIYSQNPEKVTIYLFPRPDVLPKTYLRDFLINQYFYLVLELGFLKKTVEFVVVLFDEATLKMYQTSAKDDSIYRGVEKNSLDKNLINHIEGIQSALSKGFKVRDKVRDNEIPILLNMLNVDFMAVKKAHDFL